MSPVPLIFSIAVFLFASIAAAQTPNVPSSVAAQGSADARIDASRIVDVHAINPHDYQATAVRVPSGMTPTIDGRLDDPAWMLAPVFGDFIQREPDVGALSTERTEFRVLYDDRNMYFAIWAYEDDPGGIVASEMLRDAGLRKGDAVRIVLDTFHDHRNAFYFSTNPLGAEKDGFSSENGQMNWDWNAVWQVETSRDDKGWYSEFSIPLSQIRFRGSPDEQVWGFNVGRNIIHKREETHFVPFPREWSGPGIYRMSGSGLLGGLTGLKPRRRVEFIPYVGPQGSRNYDAGTPTTFKKGYGLDFRAGLTQTLNADLTFRTDFAQVEADQEVVNLTRFNLFFPEKRQFFTEGAGTFGYGRVGEEGGGGAGLLSIFYSRTIGLSGDGREIPLLVGGRVTGNIGSYTVGFMNIETDQADYTVGTTSFHVPRSNYTVARLKRNVLKSSTIGAIALNREGAIGPSSYNRSLGLDGVFTLSNSVKLVTLLAKTFSPGTQGQDMAGVMDLAWTTDRVTASASYTDIQRDFNAEMGFIPRKGIRHSTARVNWTPRPKWTGVRQLTIGGATDYYEDHEGTPQTRGQDLNFTLLRNDRSSVRVSASNDYDRLPAPFRVGPNSITAGAYSWNTFSTTYTSDDSRRIFGGGGFDTGGYYGGDKTTYRANFNFLPKETLLIENNYTRNRITLGGAPAYITNTLNTRVSYSLSPTLFIKAFTQYNDDRRLANLNLLFWSIYRPGSDFYLVYNQGWETSVPGPQALRVRNRMLAIKLTYWLSR